MSVKKIGGFNEFVKMLRREIDETIKQHPIVFKKLAGFQLGAFFNFEF